MLLASHKGECLHCSHNGECELQELGAAFQVSQRRFPYTQRHQGKDTSSEGLVFDHNKCILCQRCVRICGDIMGVSALEVAGRGSSTRIATVLDKGLNLSSCIQCGQCTLVCPTGALQVKDSLDSVIRVLSDASSFPVVSISAASAISVGEALGIRPGKDMTGALSNALRLIGFRKVLDMTAGSGLYLQLTTALLTQRIMEGIETPIFSSCCPAWVQMAGREFQDLPGELSTVRTPSQLMELLAAYSKRDSENNQGFPTAHISVDACAARRLEGSREEADHSGIHGQQHFLNTRDLARLMKLYGIDLQMLPDQALDDPLNVYSYAGKVTAISGGTAELLAYALEERFNGKSSPERKTRKLRSNRWFKEIGLRLNGKEYAIIAINGTGRIREALE
ncbi:MAG: 4Fe-4S binding protein, partial [Bacteroidales bacterium]|nr:4Fe-4S binding protein [Bacteroidales bacterium]